MIKEENKRLATNLVSLRADTTDYKKKMGKEIREYVELKKRTRKFKHSLGKNIQGSKSEGKLCMNLNHKADTEARSN